MTQAGERGQDRLKETSAFGCVLRPNARIYKLGIISLAAKMVFSTRSELRIV
jgi:hypothetical protein